MRTTASLKGHPIHPMLIPFPFAFLTGALLFDAASRLFDKPEFGATGRHLTAAGIGAGLIAAVPGAVDYFTSVPPKSSAGERATKHALSNVAALAFFGASWFMRRGRRATGDSLAAQAAGLGMMSVGGWLGGTLVYRNQIGVDHRYADAGKWKEERAEPVGESLVVGAADDLGINQMRLVHAQGERIVVGRTEEGYRAFDDRCTHRGGPLSDGVLICGTVQCPWHGSQFDVTTGDVKCGPASTPIATHRVQASEGQLQIDAPRALVR
jgi:nitrite reductase/ring-hydroxylating ferredoxin subunit/uncharacterized membrane protein